MKTALRLSPIHSELQSLDGRWQEMNGMPALIATPRDQDNATHLGITDLSFLTRFGVKGAGAADWLFSQGIPVGDRPNSWRPLSGGGMVARLGISEFLIEDSLHSSFAPHLAAACQTPPTKVYPVLRQDLAIGLCGNLLDDLLRQTCSVNFRALTLGDRPVVLTSMVGVSVTIIPGECSGLPCYRLWCDGTLGRYLWRTLLAIAVELGGGAIGAERFLELVQSGCE
ncbi:methylglutamate dehydrogenase [filamentous cyanobacterium CCP1]|nr:methylglutamate dehydrogenase [filamentous cyanobacterium CCP2]PSB66692.1 methylglutamate dehydrogenase [filamentous cyanobacterium CCP1]